MGGPVECIRQFALKAGEFGHSVGVLTLDDDPSRWRSSWPIEVAVFQGARTAYRYHHGLVRWLRANRNQYDAVVVHGLWKYHTIAVCHALRGTDTPYFVIPHGMLNPWLKQAYPIKHLKKTLFWRVSVRRALKEAAAVVFLCEQEPILASQTFDLSQCTKEIAPLGIESPSQADRSALAFLNQFPQLRGKRTMLFLGRICLMKGCDLLLSAFSKASAIDPDCILVIAGPDEDAWQTKLEKFAKTLGIEDRVLWAGPLYGEAKYGALSHADSFVLPSHCETFPVAIVEALAYGKPVLITDKVNIWREIEQDGAGIIAPDTEAGLTELLKHWLGMGSDDKESYRLNAARCFQKRFEIGSALRAHINIYRKYAKDASETSTPPAALNRP